MPTHRRRSHKNRRSLCSSTPTTIREAQDETTKTADTPHKVVTDLKDSFLSTLTLASKACHGDIFLDDQSILLQKVRCQHPQSHKTTNDNDNDNDEEQQQKQQILQEMRRLNKIKARRKKKKGNDDNLFRATMVMGKRRDLWEQPQRFRSDNHRYQFTNAPILEVVVDNAVSSLSSSSGKSPNMIKKKKKKMKEIPLVRSCSTFTTVAGGSSLDDTATTTSTLYSANDRRLQEYRNEQDDNDTDSFLEQILDGSEEDDTDSDDDDDNDEFENLLVSHDNASVELSPSEEPEGWCSDDSAAASMLHDKYSVFS